jgi:hypothetical protein
MARYVIEHVQTVDPLVIGKKGILFRGIGAQRSPAAFVSFEQVRFVVSMAVAVC